LPTNPDDIVGPITKNYLTSKVAMTSPLITEPIGSFKKEIVDNFKKICEQAELYSRNYLSEVNMSGLAFNNFFKAG
jgi:hypothetical protein